MRAVPFEISHLDKIEAGSLEGGSDMEAFMDAIASAEGPAKTLMDGDRPLGALGILRSGEDGYSWAVFSDELRSKPFALHRIAKRELYDAAREFGCVFGTVRKDWERGARWLQAMGFEKVEDFELDNGKFEKWALKRQS